MASMFDEVRFPLAVGPGASSGPEWRTDVVALAAGGEVRNARWTGARRRWDIATVVASTGDLAMLTAFFEARRGRLRGFRFRDPTEHSSGRPGANITPQDQPLGIGDGAQKSFQLMRGSVAMTKPVAGTVRIAVDGIEQADGWGVDATTGEVTFDVAPELDAVLTAGFEFDWPVRFDTDRLEITREVIGAGRTVSLPLVELR